MNKFFVYIIRYADKSFYVGVTDNIERRFQEHSEGRGGRHTRLHKPEKIVFTENFDNKKDALKRERQLKGWSHIKKEKFILLKNRPG